MRIAGAWVGLGLGDSSDEIRRLKAHLRKKFSYARGLDDTPLFDQSMFDVVYRMQAAYHAQGKLRAPNGIVDVATKIVCGFLTATVPKDSRPMLFTVCGTGVPWWVGPDADTARAVADRYKWQPIGYPAQPVPMGPSINAGKDELLSQMTIWRDRITTCGMALAGYSQGAIIAAEVWEQEIRHPAGRAHWALPFVNKAVAWGNPSREKGKAFPDAGAATSPPDHQGVTGTLMTDTPDWWRNYAHVGDLYSDVPDDESGENRTAIWQIIRDGNIIKGPDSLISQVFELFGVRKDAPTITETTGMVKAMLDALIFFGKQTGPHVNYSTAEAIAYLKAA